LPHSIGGRSRHLRQRDGARIHIALTARTRENQHLRYRDRYTAHLRKINVGGVHFIQN
jgi:hypothetical protein